MFRDSKIASSYGWKINLKAHRRRGREVVRWGNSKSRNPESGITGHCFTNTESKNYPKHS